MEIQILYQNALKFAASKHKDQKIPGSELPYIVHLSNVAVEILMAAMHTKDFKLAFAVQVALVHDVLEDTSSTKEELSNIFGPEIASAVESLT